MTNSKQSLSVEEEGIGYLNAMIEREIEAAWRAGWRDGYSAGYRDGGSDFDWADIEADWEKSDTFNALRSRSPLEDNSSHDQQ